jgi:hypothetical protein
MNHAAIRHRIQDPGFVLRFPSLFDGRGFAFPCDAHGAVDVDALSSQARRNYLAARNAVGRDYGFPAVTPAQEWWH